MSDITQRLAEEANKDGFDPARGVEVPAVPVADATPESLLRAVRAMKSLLDVREGRGGSILDKSLSLRDLYREGIVSISVKGELLTGGGGLVAGSGGGAGGTGGGIGTLPPDYYDDPRPILTVPPAPSNLSAVGAFRDIMLDWDLLNYRNHAHVEVWRASGTNSLGSATLIGQASANLFTDTSATAGVTYYYWVRAVNIEGAAGPYNAGAAGGVVAGLGLVGNSDLSNDIIEARHLQTGAVTAGKLAVNAIVAGSAAVQDGAITNAKIGNLAVDNAKISSVNVAKLLAGSLSVGQYIRSQSYVANTSGWAINADGTAEFAFAHIRGTLLAAQIGANSITADKINTNGLTVRDTNGNLILGAGNALATAYMNPTVPTPDTRSVNSPPSSYAVGRITEFKLTSAIGLAASATHCTLETLKSWTDNSGGEAVQWAHVSSAEVWKRSAGAGASAWGGWVRDLDRSLYTGDLNATYGATIGTNLGGAFNQGTWDVVMPNALIKASHIQSLSVGVLSTTMNGGSSVGIRMEQQKLQVFDGSGVRRGLFGYLG